MNQLVLYHFCGVGVIDVRAVFIRLCGIGKNICFQHFILAVETVLFIDRPVAVARMHHREKDGLVRVLGILLRQHSLNGFHRKINISVFFILRDELTELLLTHGNFRQERRHGTVIHETAAVNSDRVA